MFVGYCYVFIVKAMLKKYFVNYNYNIYLLLSGNKKNNFYIDIKKFRFGIFLDQKLCDCEYTKNKIQFH